MRHPHGCDVRRRVRHSGAKPPGCLQRGTPRDCRWRTLHELAPRQTGSVHRMQASRRAHKRRLAAVQQTVDRRRCRAHARARWPVVGTPPRCRAPQRTRVREVQLPSGSPAVHRRRARTDRRDRGWRGQPCGWCRHSTQLRVVPPAMQSSKRRSFAGNHAAADLLRHRSDQFSPRPNPTRPSNSLSTCLATWRDLTQARGHSADAASSPP